MKKTMKKIVALGSGAVLLVSASVMGTMAYLTSQDAVTNTFTVGKVEITLDETDVNLYGVPDGTTRVDKNDYKLIPGHKYVKDPIVHVNKDSENCYVFVKVENSIAEIEDVNTIADQMKTSWTQLVDTKGQTVENVFVYKTVVDADDTNGTDLTVFSSFKIKGDADVSAYAGKTIDITAYAIQADGFDSAAAAWAAWSNK